MVFSHPNTAKSPKIILCPTTYMSESLTTLYSYKKWDIVLFSDYWTFGHCFGFGLRTRSNYYEIAIPPKNDFFNKTISEKQKFSQNSIIFLTISLVGLSSDVHLVGKTVSEALFKMFELVPVVLLLPHPMRTTVSPSYSL